MDDNTLLVIDAEPALIISSEDAELVASDGTPSIIVVTEPELLVDTVGPDDTLVITEQDFATIELHSPGPQGPAGPAGPGGTSANAHPQAIDLSGAMHYLLYVDCIVRVDHSTSPSTVARANSTQWAQRADLVYA